MKAPFTWKVTGWFMVGWSPEFPTGEVRPLQYFGEDLVAYRDEQGELHVLEAHCKHLGAHIGHGGKVVGDCVECRFHGWRWGPDGTSLEGGRAPTRTAFLRVDYRNITPIDEPLSAPGRISNVDGGDLFVTASMTAADGTLLSEANGLMVRLLPHQP